MTSPWLCCHYWQYWEGNLAFLLSPLLFLLHYVASKTGLSYFSDLSKYSGARLKKGFILSLSFLSGAQVQSSSFASL